MDKILFDLDEIDDDFMQMTNELDISQAYACGKGDSIDALSKNSIGANKLATSDGNQKKLISVPTLDEILNESDDEKDDEILKSLTSSLTTMNNTSRALLNDDETMASNTSIKAVSSEKSASSSSRSGSFVNRSRSGSLLNQTLNSTADKSSINGSSFTQTTQLERNGIVCKQAQLKQLSTQLLTAIERSDAGLPTALDIAELIAIGTSRGLVLLFDASQQTLKLYIGGSNEHKDAVSALSLNNKCDRLLVGNAMGLLFMYDTLSGKCLRQIGAEAHPAGNAILNLCFTDDSRLACFSDSGGSVFMLEFKRVMGVRSAQSTCLFSGSRGEVCHIEPLKFEKYSYTVIDKLSASTARQEATSTMGDNLGSEQLARQAAIRRSLAEINELFNRHSLLAMASFTKLFVVALRPKLTVLFTYPLNGSTKYLPIINWQFVIIQKQDQQQQQQQYADIAGISIGRRHVCPILACARESTIHFFQVEYHQNKMTQLNGESASDEQHRQQSHSSDEQPFKFAYLKKSEFKFKILNFAWLNAKTIAVLDDKEKLHITDIRTNEELQLIAGLTESVQLVYNTSFFKSLATGGHVSKALACAGDNACYQSFRSYLGKLFMLGSRSVQFFALQSWSSRIDDFVNANSLEPALELAVHMYSGNTKALIGLPIDLKQRQQVIAQKIVELLYLYVNRAIKQDCPSSGKLEQLQAHYTRVSNKCVNVCMAIDRVDILFDNIYSIMSMDPLFEANFLLSLEESFLNKRLLSGGHHVPPVIIQRFIEYYASQAIALTPSTTALAASNARSHPTLDNLERCLLNFDIEYLDLHNVIQLCLKHHLVDAYVHLHNKAFGDYVGPMEHMLVAMQAHMFLDYDTARSFFKQLQQVQPPQPSQHSNKTANNKLSYEQLTRLGNKLLVYLHCCLCGQSYPYYDRMRDDKLSDRVRRDVFDYLISKRNKIIDDMLAKHLQSSPRSPPLPPPSNYPIVRILLNYGMLDFLNVISMTFGEPSFEAVLGLEKKQQLIDILIEVCLNHSTRSASASSANVLFSSSSTSIQQVSGHLFTFLARQIANKTNNIQVGESIFAQMVEYLCNQEELDRVEEREQILLNLLSSCDKEQLSARFNINKLLTLATKAKFYRVCEILYDHSGQYYNIVDCYLSKENSLERQAQIFDVVRTLLGFLYEQQQTAPVTNSEAKATSTVSSTGSFVINRRTSSFSQVRQNRADSIEPRETQMRKLQEKLLRPYALKQMLTMNACETVHLLWIEMNMDLRELIKKINSFGDKTGKLKETRLASTREESSGDEDDADENKMNSKNKSDSDNEKEAPRVGNMISATNQRGGELSELLYKFMQGLFELVDMIKTNKKYINYMSQFNAEYCELYVDLVCCYEPEKILYFLKHTLSDYSYRTDECLRICRERKVWDGAAYLLEKSGQIEAAFGLHLEKLIGYIKELQKRLETYSEHELDVCKSSIDALLVMIVQLCQRSSCALEDSIKEKIWFSLFDEVMRPLRSLFIQPSIEQMLSYSEKSTSESDIATAASLVAIKERLTETKDFFRKLGSYIINSMVGYVNLTTIIDRIVADPLYGASNFGDIKDLMCKMLEMCTYEQTLLGKTLNIVSKDVYSKMSTLKRYSSKSYSSFASYCQYCSRPLDLTSHSGSGGSTAESLMNLGSQHSTQAVSQSIAIASTGDERKFASNELDNKIAIIIYHCGHSFHQLCLEMSQNAHTTHMSCPLCNNSSSTQRSNMSNRPLQQTNNNKKANKLKQQYLNRQQAFDGENKQRSSPDEHMPAPSSSSSSLTRLASNSSIATGEPIAISDLDVYSSLTTQQVATLKAIRIRNIPSLRMFNNLNIAKDEMNGTIQKQTNTMLEKQSKLQLSPANLAKFI
jgi:hypothetical protein